MKVLILGATGFIGGQIARAAYAAGMEVHGLRRRAGAVGAVGDLPITWHDGDLIDQDRLVSAMRGCDVLYHAAGYYPGEKHNIREAMRQAAQEMRAVLNAAKEANIRRVIYTSSLTTIGAPSPGSNHLADERDAYIPGSVRSAYYEAKWVMEHEALRANIRGLPVVILVPTAVFGPEDIKPATSEIVLRVAQGRVPVAVDVTTNFVDGRDVALAHVAAATRGDPGERYLVTGHNLDVGDLFRRIAEIAGVRPPRLTLSAAATSRLLSAARALRLPIPDLLFGVREFRPMNGEKGWHTFEFEPRPFDDTLRDTISWFRTHGYF